MKRIKSFSIALVVMIAGSCIDPFKVPEMTSMPVLVVEGLITTEPGPHRIKLSTSFSLSENQGSFVTGALLQIEDDLGQMVSVNEIGNGVYQIFPDTWQAQVGRSYFLRIQLADGKQYESEKQRISPAGNIDSIYFTYAQNSINPGDPAKPQDSFFVKLNGSGDTNSPNLLRWRWKATYEIFTRPELTRMAIPGCCLVPNPLPCSGYNNSLEQVAPCTCCTCWVNEFSMQARVSENRYISANQFLGVGLAKIPVDGLRFYTKYHIEIEQLSVDESSYTFWRLVQAQQAGVTDIFQPTVIRIRGNIRNIVDDDEIVLGVVSFSAVTRNSIFIDRSQITGNKPSLPIIIADCRDFDETSTTTPPSFW